MSAKKKEVVDVTIKSDLLEVMKRLEEFKEIESDNIPKKLKTDISKLIKQIDQFTNK